MIPYDPIHSLKGVILTYCNDAVIRRWQTWAPQAPNPVEVRFLLGVLSVWSGVFMNKGEEEPSVDGSIFYSVQSMIFKFHHSWFLDLWEPSLIHLCLEQEQDYTWTLHCGSFLNPLVCPQPKSLSQCWFTAAALVESHTQTNMTSTHISITPITVYNLLRVIYFSLEGDNCFCFASSKT